ncbi:MAG: multiheme c-type cytochrome [Chloroflexota bacterium]
MAKKKRRQKKTAVSRPAPTPRPPTPKPRRTRIWHIAVGLVVAILLFVVFTVNAESYTSLYDASYVGSESCGDCHTFTYDSWKKSPHAKMTRRPSSETVVGNFDNHSWTVPPEAVVNQFDSLPAVRMYQENGDYYMALRNPTGEDYTPFKIAYVIGYQYRQTYLTEEEGGVLRRLPLQWSVEAQAYFAYWNFQEGSLSTTSDLWAQMQSLNSAWNLYCARCHTTNLDIADKNDSHTYAVTDWTDDGIGCESCHGPGSQHVNYFASSYTNRLAAFMNSRVRGEPVAYIANAPKLTKGEDLSVCARCHGPDILLTTTEIYRVYEPGYSEEGRINDLSPYFQQLPMDPGRTHPTIETWDDGESKGIAMVFRSFVESECYEKDEVRCYDCHDPHNNKEPRIEGILEASEVSNNYCLGCHTELRDQIAEHTQHEPGTSGSFCYDCHMPQEILSIVTGIPRFTRTHTMSTLPDPENSIIHGLDGAPNSCNSCHTDESAEWAKEQRDRLWNKEVRGSEMELTAVSNHLASLLTDEAATNHVSCNLPLANS